VVSYSAYRGDRSLCYLNVLAHLAKCATSASVTNLDNVCLKFRLKGIHNGCLFLFVMNIPVETSISIRRSLHFIIWRQHSFHILKVVSQAYCV
jgi:hypothetical protein